MFILISHANIKISKRRFYNMGESYYEIDVSWCNLRRLVDPCIVKRRRRNWVGDEASMVLKDCCRKDKFVMELTPEVKRINELTNAFVRCVPI